ESKGALEIVYPEISIRAEPHVAVVDGNVDRKGTRAEAKACLKCTYTDESKEVIAANFYRPTNEGVLKKHAADFPAIRLFNITEIAKDILDAHKQRIGDGAVFDSIYKPKS